MGFYACDGPGVLATSGGRLSSPVGVPARRAGRSCRQPDLRAAEGGGPVRHRPGGGRRATRVRHRLDEHLHLALPGAARLGQPDRPHRSDVAGQGWPGRGRLPAAGRLAGGDDRHRGWRVPVRSHSPRTAVGAARRRDGWYTAADVPDVLLDRGGRVLARGDAGPADLLHARLRLPWRAVCADNPVPALAADRRRGHAIPLDNDVSRRRHVWTRRRSRRRRPGTGAVGLAGRSGGHWPAAHPCGPKAARGAGWLARRRLTRELCRQLGCARDCGPTARCSRHEPARSGLTGPASPSTLAALCWSASSSWPKSGSFSAMSPHWAGCTSIRSCSYSAWPTWPSPWPIFPSATSTPCRTSCELAPWTPFTCARNRSCYS